MTANYFMVTRAGKGLERTPGVAGPTFARGSGPSTSALTDVGFTDTFASSLTPWTGTSYNFDTEDIDTFLPTVVSGRARVAVASGVNGVAGLSREMWQGWDDVTVTAEVAPTATPNLQRVSLQASWPSVGTSGYAGLAVEDGNLITSSRGSADVDHGAYSPTAHRWWRIQEKDGQVVFSVSPNGTTWTALRTTTHTWGDPYADLPNSLSFGVENEATSGTAAEAFLDNVSARIGSGQIGVPGDLAAYGALFKPKGTIVEPRDVIAPTGFCDSVYRVVRDPAIATDDSGSTLGTQVYNHGWVLGSLLVSYLSENPAYGGRPIPWPADGGYKVLPVTGTPVVNDGAGTCGLQSVTWPGSAVGIGTLRQVVSGDEGTGRKVAAILDLLAATTNAQRDTIESTYTSTRNAINTARTEMWAVIQAASDATKKQVAGRSALAGFLGAQAVAAERGSSLEIAVITAMCAVVAKEAGLTAGVPATANYETLTQPIDAVLAMPSGY